MKYRHLSLFLTLGLGVAGSHGMDLNTLVERSPFAPPGSTNAEPENAAPAQLEFRGIATDDSGTMFSVFDLSANRGYWVREGGEGEITVKSFDPAEGEIVVQQGGRTLPLKLKRAAILAGEMMPAPAMPTPGMPSQAAGNASTDAGRLEAVAAEVRRRRALRNSTRGGAMPTPPPQTATAPATP